jgi:ABC-type cobalamin transport system permease subunit
MKSKFSEWLNLALMANLFLVLLSFAWFAIAVLGESLHLSLGLNLWYKFWQPVISPAIGILIVGAILSGIISWVNKRFFTATLERGERR